MNEETLISLAIERSQRGRYRELLKGRKRGRLLDQLNHTPPLDERSTRWFSTFSKALATIRVGSGARVYLLSAAPDLDGQVMAFQEAVDAVPRAGCGTIMGISSSLAVYYGEDGERTAIIQKEP